MNYDPNFLKFLSAGSFITTTEKVTKTPLGCLTSQRFLTDENKVLNRHCSGLEEPGMAFGDFLGSDKGNWPLIATQSHAASTFENPIEDSRLAQ